MFEKISNAAERLATNVSESRRGFLVRVGQAALGVAGVVTGLLAMPTEAQAGRSGYCQAGYYGIQGTRRLTGQCVCSNPCGIQPNASQCGGWGAAIISFCGYRVATSRPCTCT
jgi:hypothetical protein